MNKFNKYQQAQLNIAKNNFPEAVSLLEQHPEWSSTLMNMVANRIHKRMPYEPLIDFAEAGRIVHNNEEDRTIGKFDMLVYAWNIIETIGQEDFATDYLKKNPEISANKLLYDVIQETHKEEYGSVRVRLSENSQYANNDSGLFALMSEGKDKIVEILKAVQRKSIAVDKEMKRTHEKKPTLGGQLFLVYMNILALDDMNIRGEQIKYAYEYCDNDITTFIQCIRARDKNMIDYVNYKSVERAIKDDIGYINKAVSAEASFPGFRDDMIYEFEYDLYKEPIKPLKDTEKDLDDYELY